MKNFLALFFLVFCWQVLPCKPVAPKAINFHADLEKGVRKYYSSKRILDDRPSLSFDSCEVTASSNKFIMIGLGLENLILSNDTIGFNFTPDEEKNNCRLKNNPFPVIETAEDRYKKSLTKREFFNRCIVMQVTELNEYIGLRMPEQQPGCQVKRVSKWSYNASGSFCYIQPHRESQISVHLDIREKCLNKTILNEKETILGDYNALLNAYIAGDASGFSPDLTAISTTQVRFSISPPKGLIALSDDFGVDRPRWPTTWKAGDLFLGQLKVRNLDGINDELSLPLVSNTICERRCIGNLCSSPCDFSQPVVGEFTLYELVNGKKEFIKLWHDGSVASPNYQGLLHGMGVTVQRGVLKEGSTFLIEANFREPELDFSYFSGRVSRELRLRRNYIGPFARGGEIGLIPQISTIGNTNDVPTIPFIQNLTFDNSSLDGLSVALASWQAKLQNAFWPPYYIEMCSSFSSSCLDSGRGQVLLSTKFTLSETGSDEWKVNLIEGKRISNIVPNKTWSEEDIPSVKCGEGDEDNDDDDFDWGDIL